MNRLIIFLILTTTLISCEDKIDLDVPTGPRRLVVDAVLSDADSVQTITLSTTSPYFENSRTPRISNAEVYVTTSKGDTVNFTEWEAGSGDYKAGMTLHDTNILYTLHVLWEGKKYRSYTEKMNRVPPIDSLRQSDKKFPIQGDFRDEGYAGLLTTREPKGTGDYYRWVIFINGEKQIDPFNLIFTDDRLVDGNLIKDWDIVYELKPGDMLEIYQMSISERAYNFWSLLFAQITKFGGPFDTPPAPIEGNVFNENDSDEQVLGFFGVSKVEKATLLVLDK